MRPTISFDNRSKQAILALGMAAALGLILFGSGCRPTPMGQSTSGAASGTEGDTDSGTVETGGGKGQVAPDFMLSDVTGQQVSLSESNGRVRLIDFWATWCAPCRDEIPMMVELDQQYRDQGLTILAITDENLGEVKEFVQEYGVTYTNLIGSEDLAMEYLVLGLPTGFLIDREGKIIERYVGPKPRKILESQIRELLELPPQT